MAKKDKITSNPKSAIGKVISYCLNQWPQLINFMIDGHLDIDYIRAERSFRPFVIRRGAKSSSIINSIIETAKENNLNPFPYLTHILEQLSLIDIDDPAAIEHLLLWSTTLPDYYQIPQKELNQAYNNAHQMNRWALFDAYVYRNY